MIPLVYEDGEERVLPRYPNEHAAKKTKNVAILGHGFAGKLHREVIENYPVGLKVTAIADTNPDAVKGLSGKYVVVDSLDKLLQTQGSYDAVIVATPVQNHEEAVAKLAENNIPMLLEKPIAENFAEADRICGKAHMRVPCMVGLTGRFHPEFREAYKHVITFRTGNILSMNERIHLGDPSFKEAAFLNAYLSGERGIGLENGYHTFDRIQWFTGSPIKSIRDLKKGRNLGGKSEDYANGIAVTESGLTVPFSWRWSDVKEEDYVFDVIGEKTSVTVHGFKDCARIIPGTTEHVMFSHDLDQDMRERHKPGFAKELEHFARYLNDPNSCKSLLTEAMDAQRAVELLYRD